MDIKGKITQVMALLTGQGKTGNAWRKQEFVIETVDQYPKKVYFHLWGDKIEQNPLSVGSDVTVSFDVESREYNGRWYTDLRAWKVVGGHASNASNQNTETAPAASETAFTEEASDDLPF